MFFLLRTRWADLSLLSSLPFFPLFFGLLLQGKEILTVGADRFGFNSIVPINTLRSLYLVRSTSFPFDSPLETLFPPYFQVTTANLPRLLPFCFPFYRSPTWSRRSELLLLPRTSPIPTGPSPSTSQFLSFLPSPSVSFSSSTKIRLVFDNNNVSTHTPIPTSSYTFKKHRSKLTPPRSFSLLPPARRITPSPSPPSSDSLPSSFSPTPRGRGFSCKYMHPPSPPSSHLQPSHQLQKRTS